MDPAIEQLLSFVAGPSSGLGHFEGMTLVEALAVRVAQCPDGRFVSFDVSDGERSQSYAELWARSGRIATALTTLRLAPASPIVLLTEDGLDFIPAFWACLRAGHVAVPLISAAQEFSRKGCSSALARASFLVAPAAVIGDVGLRHVAREVLPEIFWLDLTEADGAPPLASNAPAADTALLLPTSGTTGTFKLVALSPRALLYRAFTNVHAPSGTHVGVFPIDSTTGMRCALLQRRVWVRLPMSSIAHRPEHFLDVLARFRATDTGLTNTLAETVLNACEKTDGVWDLSALERFGLGAETVSLSTVKRLDALLQRFGSPPRPVRSGYGTTETGLLVAGADPLASGHEGVEAVTLGPCAPNVEIRIVDEAGQLIPQGQPGNVEVRCDGPIFSSYWGEADSIADCFTQDGWWRTGDTGLLRDGQLTIAGRTKDVFIANGRKIALGAIDEVLRSTLDPGEAIYACAIPGRDGRAETLGIAVLASPGRLPAIETPARQAVGRAFQLPITVIRSVPSSAIPLTPTGKVKRLELAALLSQPEPAHDEIPAAVGTDVTPASVNGALALIWEVVLGPGSARDPDANFFVFGGDSLRASELFARIERELGIAANPRRFYESPTLAMLRDIVEATPPLAARNDPPAPDIWPLFVDQYRKQLVFIEAWGGERPTANRLVLSFNNQGSRPPIFLLCQMEHEVTGFSQHFGPDQPVFGFRSGWQIIAHRDDEVQAFALRYVADIQALHPTGPVLLAGICQGGIIALAMAQHLLRRGRHVPLLALMEWPARLQHYPGRVLFIYAEASPDYNPYFKFREPERGWQRHHTEAEIVIVPGDHWEYLQPHSMAATAAILADKIDRALGLPALYLADEHRKAGIQLGSLPSRITAGQIFTVEVGVTNAGPTPWSETARSGLMLGYRWLDATGEPIELPGGRSSLPFIAPGCCEDIRLTVTAPRASGKMSLLVDVVEEGSVWFGFRLPEKVARAAIDILEVRADPATPAFGELRGYLDGCDGLVVYGWAQDMAFPEDSVCLDIIANGAVVGWVYANEHREDLESASIGDGSHAFKFTLPDSLTNDGPHTITVRRSVDGVQLIGTVRLTAIADAS